MIASAVQETGLESMYTILKCGNMSFSVTMDDQSFDESIACNEGVDERVDYKLRYHVHDLYCDNWSCV